MAEIDSISHVYKIPSKEIIANRRKFYRLKKKDDEQIEAWLERGQTQIKCCEFPKIVEFLLIDKFMCELKKNEIEFIRSAVDTWSIERLHEHFGKQKIGVDQLNGENAMIDNSVELNEEIPLDDIKHEVVSYEIQKTCYVSHQKLLIIVRSFCLHFRMNLMSIRTMIVI